MLLKTEWIYSKNHMKIILLYIHVNKKSKNFIRISFIRFKQERIKTHSVTICQTLSAVLLTLSLPEP